MTATLGNAFILASLACAMFGAVVGLWTGLTRRETYLPWVRRSVIGFVAGMFGANFLMVYALVTHDFSLKYVAKVGSLSTPLAFTIVSLWSDLEGSILFWGFILGAYLLAFSIIHRHERGRFTQLSLGMMCLVSVFFAFLIAGPANPWEVLPNPPSDGPGPNPLLQNHLLMIIHPPFLYGGYVGMTVPFGIAAGALLCGEMGESWTAPLRKWTLVAWIFLSIGIILGSWWAYAVLGWGGYWAWDPVENASFLPWLTATAFMHSTMVLERKKMLKLWTLALALGSFVLTIVGTFMTRSGVFNSVHSFTQSDIGPTFLVFIAIVSVFSILLLAFRGHLLVAESGLSTVVSREGSILVNNLVFSAFTFTVFLGTTYPLILEAMTAKRITVGEPYFNKMAVPAGLMILFLMGVGPMLPWGQTRGGTFGQQILLPGVGALIALAISLLTVGPSAGFPALLSFALAGFVVAVTLRELFLPAQQRMTERNEGWWNAMVHSASRAPRRFGGYIVHLGIVAIIVAVAASASSKQHSTATLKVGESLTVGDYKIRFDGLSSGKEPHRDWKAANISIIAPNGSIESRVGRDGPRMNYYERSTEPIGSPAIQAKVTKDVYVSLLSFDPTGASASFNAWVFPLVGWIWYAIPILVLGTLISLWPQRTGTERSREGREVPAPAIKEGAQ